MKEEEKSKSDISRKSRRINIEEFGYDGQILDKARNSVNSLNRQTLISSLSANKQDKNIL